MYPPYPGMQANITQSAQNGIYLHKLRRHLVVVEDTANLLMCQGQLGRPRCLEKKSRCFEKFSKTFFSVVKTKLKLYLYVVLEIAHYITHSVNDRVKKYLIVHFSINLTHARCSLPTVGWQIAIYVNELL